MNKHVSHPTLVAWREAARKRGAKYSNVITHVGDEKFDSRAEANRWLYLTTLVRAKQIADLRRQVSYELVPKQARPSGGFERPVVYIADFTYTDVKSGRSVVEDVKGASTDVWIIKRKLMLHVHGIEVLEVKA